MARGRKPLKPAEQTGETLGLITQEAFAEEAAIVALEQQLLNHSEVLVRAGRIQMADFNQKVNRVAAVNEFEAIRESKKFKGLAYRDKDGKQRHVIDLDEFCEVFLGRSYPSLAEDSRNKKMLGGELYDRALTLGLTTRNFREIRSLPQDDQALVKEAIAAKSRETVIEILESVIVNHGKEKHALEKQIKNLEGDLDAQRQITAKKDEKLNELDAALHRRQSLPADDWIREAVQELTHAGLNARSQYLAVEVLIGEIQEREDVPEHVHAACAHVLVLGVKAIYEIAQRRLMQLDQELIAEEIFPQWMRNREPTKTD